MASIIRGPVSTHPQPSFTSHSTHPAMQSTYSTHLPRGAAAVANITTLKPAVATPIPRSHLLTSSVVTSSSGTHHLVQPRISSASTVRGPLPSKTLTSLSSDISHISASSTSSIAATQIVLANSRTNEGSLRPAVIHGTPVISKPASFTSQMPGLEKGFYKPTATAAAILPVQTTSTSMTLSTTHSPAHVAVAQPSTQIQSLALSSSATQIHIPTQLHPQLVSHSISLTGAQVGSITPSAVSGGISHTHTNLPKVITHSGSSLAHLIPNSLTMPNRTLKAAPICSSVVTQSSSKAIVSSNNAIPVAKVYPQPLAVVSRSTSEIAHGDPIRNSGTATLFVSPTQRATATHLTVNAAPAPSTSGIVVSSGNASAGSSNVILADSRSERPVVANSTYNFTTGAYFYESISTVPNTLTMHSLPGSSTSSHTFTAVPTNIRTGFMASHPSSTISVQPNVRTTTVTSVNVNSVMMSSARGPQIITSIADTTTSSEPSSANVSSSSATVSSTVSSPATSTSSSPRPGILRKRTIDGSQISSTVKRNLLPCLSPKISSTHSEASSSTTFSTVVAKTLSERDAAVENGQSFEAASSTNNSLTALSVHIKQEPMDSTESATTSTNNSLVALLPEASPRKKPRKQQLTGNELVETHSTEGEDEFEKEPKEPLKKEVVQEESSRNSWVAKKNRPPVSLLNSYRHTWKSRHNHFIRYTDVKPREERRPSVIELASQKYVVEKLRGWKIYRLCAQFEELVDLESSAHTRLATLLEEMQKKVKLKDDGDPVLTDALELMMGNIQRCKSITDQMKEAKQQFLKVLEHKTRVTDIVNKFVPKQSSRRRDKTLSY
ncbi:hypothetical protein CHUAL_001215 [Chamberlinius hualienensis]